LKEQNSRMNKDIQELKIGSITWPIERRKPPITECDGCNVVGRVNYDAGKILVSDALSDHIELLTIVHEAVHVLLACTGEKSQDESQVEMLGHLLLDFIRNNPTLIMAIQASPGDMPPPF